MNCSCARKPGFVRCCCSWDEEARTVLLELRRRERRDCASRPRRARAIGVDVLDQAGDADGALARRRRGSRTQARRPASRAARRSRGCVRFCRAFAQQRCGDHREAALVGGIGETAARQRAAASRTSAPCDLRAATTRRPFDSVVFLRLAAARTRSVCGLTGALPLSSTPCNESASPDARRCGWLLRARTARSQQQAQRRERG